MAPSVTAKTPQDIGSLAVDFDNRRLIDFLLKGLVGLVEDVAGVDDASIFVSSVAGRLGAELEGEYMKALGVQRFTREQLSAVLVDLENRAGGAFFVIEENAERIVLGNSVCPFGLVGRGHASLCMMTSNLLGRLSANALGHAAVDLEQTIASGAPGCRVVIHLKPTEFRPDTREYFRDDAFPS